MSWKMQHWYWRCEGFNPSSIDFSDGTKWNDCVWTGSLIVGVPFTSNDFLVIDPVAGTSVRTNYDVDFSGLGTAKFTNGVMLDDGRLFCGPANSSLFLTVQGTTIVQSTFGLPAANLNGGSKWAFIKAADGRVFGIPRNKTFGVQFDPVAQTVVNTTWGLTFASTLYNSAGVLASDNKIYVPPYNAVGVLILDPTNNTAVQTSFNIATTALSDLQKWGPGAVAPDGKLWFAPMMAPDFLVIDPVGQTMVRSHFGFVDISTPAPGGGDKFNKMVSHPNGKFYLAPRGSSLSKINPLDMSQSQIAFGKLRGEWGGVAPWKGSAGNKGTICLDGNNNPWLVPNNITAPPLRMLPGV